MLFFRTHSANSIKESVETVLSLVVSRAFPICVWSYILPPWRIPLTARCPRHTLEVQINNLVFWIFTWVLLPSSFMALSENVKFHLQRQKLIRQFPPNFFWPPSWPRLDKLPPIFLLHPHWSHGSHYLKSNARKSFGLMNPSNDSDMAWNDCNSELK